MTPEEFEALSEAKKQEAIDYNNEQVRQWRAVCQLCKVPLVGTLAHIRAHRCSGGSSADTK